MAATDCAVVVTGTPCLALPRRAALVAGALLASLLFAVWLGAGSAQATAGVGLPPQGIFETCSLESTPDLCAQRLSVMHSGGLSVVVITPGSAPLSALDAYAAQAHSLGMSVMWELSNPSWWRDPADSTNAAGNSPQFAAACGCRANGPLLAFTVRWLGALPGTYGYYAADDSMLSSTDRAGVAGYVAAIHSADPAHPSMIGAFRDDQRQQYQGIADMVGQELYPVTTDPLLPRSTEASTWASVDQSISDEQSGAQRTGTSAAFILQGFTWGGNLDDGTAIGACTQSDTPSSCNARLSYPSASAQLALRNAALRVHPRLILWYSFPGTYGPAGAPSANAVTPSPEEDAARWTGLSGAVQAPAPSVGVQPRAAHAATAKARAKAKRARARRRAMAARHRAAKRARQRAAKHRRHRRSPVTG